METSKPGLGSAVVLVWAILGWALPPAAAQQEDRGVEVVTIEPDAESRRALVVGNAAYERKKLHNPLNDAADMGAMLEELGFEVQVLKNAGRQAMEDAIRAFGQRLRTGGVGVFYYAGHAVQVDGLNYLVPVGAEIRAENEIPHKTLSLGFLLGHMGKASNRLNIVILDACRDNPFRGFRSLKRGLAETRVPTGTYIAYATAPGGVAADGTGRHGVFTEHLLAELRVPGLTIEEVMKRTRRAVAEATAGQQVPWASTSLVGDFIPRPFSIADLSTQADAFEETRRAWEKKLEAMKAGFEEAKRLTERVIPAELKVEGWQRFLAAFAEENPFSAEDDAMRSEAIRQQERWRWEAEKVAAKRRVVPEPPSSPPLTPKLAERWEEKAVGMWFRYIPPGRFRMGSPQREEGRDRHFETLHRVVLTRGFWIGETEVTQEQWQRLAGKNPSKFRVCGGNCPVENVSWSDARWYANELSKRAGLESCYEFKPFSIFRGVGCLGYRLPTEAEWEYAARAGTKTPFWTGKKLTADQANCAPEDRRQRGRGMTVEVRSFDRNPWGLYEVHGNVEEWVWDRYGQYGPYVGDAVDPVGSDEGSAHYRRVARGGSFGHRTLGCRAAHRSNGGSRSVGFRLVRTAPVPVPPRQPELAERLEEKPVGMWFRYIPPGSFQMGSPKSERGRYDNETLHQVELTRGFWIAETEVTQEQWQELAGNNPSRFKVCGGSCPVENVNWYEALWYANKLSKLVGFDVCYKLSDCNWKNPGEDLVCGEVIFKGLGCTGYRLPTEAEWEYAARAGTTTPFWTGENLTTNQANYDGNYPYAGRRKGENRKKTVEVRSLDPNPWGLYEVHGNVWEWVWDWDVSYNGRAVDPIGPLEPRGVSNRVIRGGSWRHYARDCRAARRKGNAPGDRWGSVGFRLVRTDR